MLSGTKDGSAKFLSDATSYRTTKLNISEHYHIYIHNICNFKSHNALTEDLGVAQDFA